MVEIICSFATVCTNLIMTLVFLLQVSTGIINLPARLRRVSAPHGYKTLFSNIILYNEFYLAEPIGYQ